MENKPDNSVETMRSLMIEQFKSLQAETQLRIGENHKLTFFKMASCGALFSYAFAVGSPSVLSSLLAPLIAVMVDFLIVNNLCLIGVMGVYIRDKIENPSAFEGFETFVTETKFDQAKPVTWLIDWLVINGSTLVIYLLAATVIAKYYHNTWWLGFIVICFVALYLLDVAYSSITLNILSELKAWIFVPRRSA